MRGGPQVCARAEALPLPSKHKGQHLTHVRLSHSIAVGSTEVRCRNRGDDCGHLAAFVNRGECFMDKSSPSKEMSLASPLSAGALYQFLSSQRADRGLKIKNAYTAPVLKTRDKAEPLSEEQRKAWTFYLKEI